MKAEGMVCSTLVHTVYAFQVSSAPGILHDFRATGPGHGQACFYGYYDSGFPVLYSELLLNCLLEVITAAAEAC